MTTNYTIQNALDNADPDEISDALRKVALGALMTPIIETITLAVEAAAFDLSVDSVAKKAALLVQAVEITNAGIGTADVGPRLVAPSGATPAAAGVLGCGVCTVSDDGKVLTFEGTALAIKVAWIPMPNEELTDRFVANS